MTRTDDQNAADDPTAALLERLLAERLPGRRRCGSCEAFESDDDGTGEGWCANLIPPSGGCAANDRCTAWVPLRLEWYDQW